MSIEQRAPARAAVWFLALIIGLAAAPVGATPPHVILISLDGTRPVDVTPDDLGAVHALRTEGASAQAMIGVTPSNTFPSHVSLATGVAPERHGLVNNTFFDDERGRFDKKAPDIPAWIQVEPIWSWLAGQGVVSASYYWVGSEGPWPPSRRGARHWKRFSGRTTEETKVEQILAWLDLEDEAEHPRFISSWFHGADHAGHHDGPGSPKARASLRVQNTAIETLIAGLEQRGAFAYTTLVFVSDHGMVGAERTVALGSVYGGASLRAKVTGIGGFAIVRVESGADRAERARRAVELARAKGLEAYLRTEAPADWRVDHPRFGDVVVRAPIGTAIVYPGLSLAGYHGYDPQQEPMHAMFFARGRGARPGTDLGVVRVIDVAPTVLHLLGLEPPSWMEGRVIEGLRVDGAVPTAASRAVPSARGSARLGDPVAAAGGGAE